MGQGKVYKSSGKVSGSKYTDILVIVFVMQMFSSSLLISAKIGSSFCLNKQTIQKRQKEVIRGRRDKG